MTLFSEYVSWENYLSTLVGEYESEEEVAESRKIVAEAVAMSGSGGNVTTKRVNRDSDPAVIKARQAYTQARAMRHAYTIQRDSVSRTSQFISRELSRRIGRDPVERRAARLGGG